MFNNEVFDRLNPEQQEAVLHTEGPLLILAGAGSGKTRVLTCRIAHLVIDKNVAPKNILAVTFTNKAAKEMRDRATALAKGVNLSDMWACTFHSMCARILRVYFLEAGYKPRFQIYDTDDSIRIMQDTLSALEYPDKKNDAKEWLDNISFLKANAMTPEAARKSLEDDPLNTPVTKGLADVYAGYQRRLREANAMDFDDLQMNVELLFKANDKIRQAYARRFHYIMVDEYQDTNPQQFRLINMLAQEHRNLMVVGDDDQSIYAFRGADIRNILDFEKHFEGAHVIKLEQNYRSTKNILDAANAVIANNTQRKDKALRTTAGPGPLLTIYEGMFWGDEARYAADTIKMMLGRGRHYSDIAILYRMNSQAAQYEKAFINAAIPYKIIGGHAFFDRAEIRDLIAYLKFIYNESDMLSAKRIINVPKRAIGDTTVRRMQAYADVNKIPFVKVLEEPSLVKSLSPATRKNVDKFMAMVRDFRVGIEDKTVDDILLEVIDETDFYTHLADKKEDIEKIMDRADHVKTLSEYTRQYTFEHNGAKGMDALGGFLEEVALISGSERESGNKGNDCVSLMTVHAAKGLEFPVVFLAGMNDGIFPNTWHGADEMTIEEERRLCYVGITRAKEELYLTRTKAKARSWGSTQNDQKDEEDEALASRFLSEIPTRLCNTPVEARPTV